MGFVAFVRKTRMTHATALLRNTTTPIADISYMIGYENPESFIRAFKKMYTVSPSQYRKQNTVQNQS
jgi:AraC-like DNA-binding protein